MPNLQQIALQAMRAFNPEATKKVEQELRNYSQDKAGLQKLVKKYGGRKFIDEAANFANNAPKVKSWFDRFGVDPNKLKDNVVDMLDSDSPPQQPKPTSSVSNYRDRLSKMK